MFEAHPRFIEPASSAAVWRYMDLARFISLAATSALYFTRSDLMADRWEGAFGEANERDAREFYGGDYQSAFQTRRLEREHARRMVHLNCWHVAEYESAAMWETYQREGRGVAIRTTWGHLKESIVDSWQVFGGLVEYADYRTTQIDESNLYAAFLVKRLSFEYEREARLVFNSATLGLPGVDVKQTRAVGALVSPPGYSIEIDLASLRGTVFVAPAEPAWVLQSVRSLVASLEAPFEVEQSALSALP